MLGWTDPQWEKVRTSIAEKVEYVRISHKFVPDIKVGEDIRSVPVDRYDDANNATPIHSSSSGMLQTPAISLPKGGGAILGIGEKFTAGDRNWLHVAAHCGKPRLAGPQLSLSYDSGSGNGPFGFKWNFSIRGITAKPAKDCRSDAMPRSRMSTFSRAPKSWSHFFGQTARGSRIGRFLNVVTQRLKTWKHGRA
jgi:hypothetical protein